jgi:hypothetical protein
MTTSVRCTACGLRFLGGPSGACPRCGAATRADASPARTSDRSSSALAQAAAFALLFGGPIAMMFGLRHPPLGTPRATIVALAMGLGFTSGALVTSWVVRAAPSALDLSGPVHGGLTSLIVELGRRNPRAVPLALGLVLGVAASAGVFGTWLLVNAASATPHALHCSVLRTGAPYSHQGRTLARVDFACTLADGTVLEDLLNVEVPPGVSSMEGRVSGVDVDAYLGRYGQWSTTLSADLPAFRPILVSP